MARVLTVGVHEKYASILHRDILFAVGVLRNRFLRVMRIDFPDSDCPCLEGQIPYSGGQPAGQLKLHTFRHAISEESDYIALNNSMEAT
jgi:hypothetical protein